MKGNVALNQNKLRLSMNKKMQSMTSSLGACLVELAKEIISDSLRGLQRDSDALKYFCTETSKEMMQ